MVGTARQPHQALEWSGPFLEDSQGADHLDGVAAEAVAAFAAHEAGVEGAAAGGVGEAEGGAFGGLEPAVDPFDHRGEDGKEGVAFSVRW